MTISPISYDTWLEEIQRWVELIKDQPELLIDSTYSFTEKLKSAMKFLYDHSKTWDRLTWKKSILKELIIDEMSIDQIWEELCLDNRPFLQRSSSRLGAIRKGLEHPQPMERSNHLDIKKKENEIIKSFEEFPTTILTPVSDHNGNHHSGSPYGKLLDDTSSYYTADEQEPMMIPTPDTNNRNDDDELSSLDSKELEISISSLSSEKESQEEKSPSLLSEESDMESLKSEHSKSSNTKKSISRSSMKKTDVTGKTAMYSDFFDPPVPHSKEKTKQHE